MLTKSQEHAYLEWYIQRYIAPHSDTGAEWVRSRCHLPGATRAQDAHFISRTNRYPQFWFEALPSPDELWLVLHPLSLASAYHYGYISSVGSGILQYRSLPRANCLLISGMENTDATHDYLQLVRS